MIRHVGTLNAFKELIAKERTTGVVRLAPDDPKEAAPVLAEVRRVEEIFPALQILVLRGTLSDEDGEERCAGLLAEHAIKDTLLLLPHWWILWQGRVAAVYKQGNIVMRDLLTMFGGRHPVDAVVDWIERNLRVERGTGRIADARTSGGTVMPPIGATPPPPPPPARPPPGSMNPYKVLGVVQGAPLEVARKAYKKLVAAHHPDKFATAGEKAQAEAHERIVMINAAYEMVRKAK